ncbi:AP2/ERF and B3 domain-containing transcription factor At1g50680-like [Aristolochia californica]|uniref:AP2/ERF and B3 domain-containing transcription factor At1g50680-like n=1 Tax=Aristolochia californica TaxID=171875 RepID=UPI0035D641DC
MSLLSNRHGIESPARRFSSDDQMLAVIPHPLTHGAADSSDSTSAHRPYKRQRHESGTAPSRFKGVVLQQNGHWGAQIYAHHQRIWLGTFKSEQAAAMAYDSSAIKLRSGDCHRNFPWTTHSDREHAFQNLFTTEDVLGMIKEGSYESKFAEYIRTIQNATTVANSGAGYNLANGSGPASQGGVICQELFLKELTPSDVGKLNRLVIPKKHAVKFFPPVSETEEGEETKDIQLVFFDKYLRSWKFRYCYWKSSQSYVFTRGWNRFVRDKELKAKDLVTFYNCEYRKGLEGVDRSWMIDVNYNNETNVNTVGVFNHEMMVGLELALGRQYTSKSDDEDNEKGEEDEDVQQIVRQPLAKKKCLRLFGVTIG